MSESPDVAAVAALPDEALTQFLYRVPIGLMQTTVDGEIEMINPTSVQLLMPITADGNIVNLFTVTESVAPQLRGLVEAFDQPSGIVCESLRIPLIDNQVGDSGSKVLSISVLKLNPSRLMAVLSDATLEVLRERQNLESELSDAARVDGLTKLPNRAAAKDQIQSSLDRATAGAEQQFALLFINCDRFRQVNDTLGHAVGDEVLSLIASRLRASLRGQSHLNGIRGRSRPMIARIGGDEFVVVLDELNRADDAHAVAQRLIDVLSRPYGVGKAQLHCSVSMGVVLQAQAGGSADAALRDASIAMVEAKRAGGARYSVFEPRMQEHAAQRSAMEADLRVALAEGQLFVVYQPVVRLSVHGASDRCAGVEALVRWQHPVRGLISPVEFIGVAEERGLIDAIGEFVLRTACRQFMSWQHELGARAPRTLAVNISRAQLAQPGLAGSVHDILRRSEMRPELLQLEVTESLAAQDETVQSRLHELKKLGLKLALDDFGTGYSSLSSLHLLPVDTVKIDRSFVTHVETSRHHQVLIEATIRVAHSLGMSTVAEGIETAGQAAALCQLLCEKGQGFFFSKPLPAWDVAEWLTTEDAFAISRAQSRQASASRDPERP